VVTQSVSPNHLELSSEDPEELVRLVSFLQRAFHEDISLMGVVRVSLIFVREGLTDEVCIDRFREWAASQLEEQRAQTSLDI